MQKLSDALATVIGAAGSAKLNDWQLQNAIVQVQNLQRACADYERPQGAAEVLAKIIQAAFGIQQLPPPISALDKPIDVSYRVAAGHGDDWGDYKSL